MRNREGQELVELVARNGLAIAGSFFQMREIHKVSCRRGQHRTELDLAVGRKRQLWIVKDCKAVAGEHVTTQHPLVVFVVCIERRKDIKRSGWKMFQWGKWSGNAVMEYKERMRARYDQLEEAEGLEEWKKKSRRWSAGVGRWRRYDAGEGVRWSRCCDAGEGVMWRLMRCGWRGG